MTPAQARAFRAVAIEGSFTAAARRLGVSQPTLSNQIKALEAFYQVELLHRSGRGVRLTRTGEQLLSIVRRMFGSFQEAVEFLQATQGMRRGHLRIGSYGPYDVVHMLARFKRKFPGVQSSLAFANSRDLAKLLLEYDLDVAVFSCIEEHPEFHILPYSRPPLIAIAPRSEEWMGRRSMSSGEFEGHQLLCREPGSAAREAFDQLLAAAGLSSREAIEIGSREGIVSAVAAGIGISVIFDEGLIPVDQVVKLRLRDHNIRTHVDVVCLAERRESPTIQGFLEIAEPMSDERRRAAAVPRRRQ